MGAKLAVKAGTGTITVTGVGTPNEAVQIVVSMGGTQVATESGNLDAHGNGSYTFQQLQPGTYDVTVTAPSPNGTVYDYPGQVVS